MNADLGGFWFGKRVLVTGHTGFKGAWLSLWLNLLGARVVGFSDGIPTDPSLTAQSGLEHSICGLRGDIADAPLVLATLAEHQPEIVFHLAAQSLVRASYDDPLATFRTNVFGTAAILDAVREVGCVRSTVVVTSDKCYRNDGSGRRFREDDPLGGHDPYSASKACAEHVAAAFRSSYGSETFVGGIATVRAGNVIGGGDWSADRILPDAARAVAANRPLLVRNPASTRPWQHVLDCLHAYLVVAERTWAEDSAARAWNIGPATGTESVEWIVERAERRWDGALRWRAEPQSNEMVEAVQLQLDPTDAELRLGWRAIYDTGTAVDVTVDWYRAVAAGADPRAVTLDQIRRHMELTT